MTQEEKLEVLKDSKEKSILHNSLDSVLSNRVIACKTSKEKWDTLEVQCQGIEAIEKNLRAWLVQEYERYETNPDEDLTDSYDRFLTLLSNVSLAGKEYEVEDFNTKFFKSLPEEWDIHSSIIRHQYDLSTVSLDEVYGLLRTHDLEIQQRKARNENRDKSLALRAKTKKEKSNYVEKRQNQIRNQVSVINTISVTEDSSGDDDNVVLMKQRYRRLWTGHFAKDCTKPKADGSKGKALLTSTKDWMESSSESEGEEVNYALVASFEETKFTNDSSTDKDTFENDKNESKEKDLKDIFVKESSDKHDEISKTVSTNFVCDEKAISHEEKKTEKVFVKKTEKSNNDVKRKISNTEKKEKQEKAKNNA
ncbi:uncharacterized protein LOC108194442 [Daucus carota subsp. sativus]|uniref:uncharacterized protein LOC108194442 n=1 Tax=Daucus carota subsp. sativus TaxID=79200 RepID=UPI0007EF131B|nr:PREDICTED: uncharacterized protein LOC108194442 [Daucus carota subsp. sativus]